ncbi:MAG: hypothetical protein A2461_05910 [Burkholderiales bacterium RIFOXYC2_FULL_59_8]|nr:MAG: hypothetical protein A2461_05910 [Burkholderiales bacterium RIFOXYC2_FULL_59_8]
MSDNVQLLIFDSNDHTRALLRQCVSGISCCDFHFYPSTAAVAAAHLPDAASIMVLNHQTFDPSPVAFLTQLRTHQPNLYIVLIVSPGPEKRALDPLRRGGQIDMVFEKPLHATELEQHLQEHVADIFHSHHLETDHLNLLRFVPTGGLRRIFDKPEPGHAELFDMAVLFTDIRDSSSLILQASAKHYFAHLNAILGEQAQLIRNHDGMVVKTTGDGLLAVFEGAERCDMALKCAHAIQRGARSMQTLVGAGVSDGQVLTGILGTLNHLHFDVIGSPVHLASRLCSLAQPGEILATQHLADAAHFDYALTPIIESVEVRGFSQPVTCVHIHPDFTEAS